jgi:hypothetical protein
MNEMGDEMTETKLRFMKVLGPGGLRAFVKKYKIFKGISNLNKKDIVKKILASKWWDTNIVNGFFPVLSGDDDELFSESDRKKQVKKKVMAKKKQIRLRNLKRRKEELLQQKKLKTLAKADAKVKQKQMSTQSKIAKAAKRAFDLAQKPSKVVRKTKRKVVAAIVLPDTMSTPANLPPFVSAMSAPAASLPLPSIDTTTKPAIMHLLQKSFENIEAAMVLLDLLD